MLEPLLACLVWPPTEPPKRSCDLWLTQLAPSSGACSTGVSITMALPSAIDTEFQHASGLATARVFTLPGVRKVGGIVMSAEAVSRATLDAALKGRLEVVPGLLPRLFVGLTD